MSTIRKELEFPAPPEGWEIDRFGAPAIGEMYFHVGDWKNAGVDCSGIPDIHYLIARKKQSPAEWANAQPDLAALARVLEDDTVLYLRPQGRHDFGGRGPITVVFNGFPGSEDARIATAGGKWVDTP